VWSEVSPRSRYSTDQIVAVPMVQNGSQDDGCGWTTAATGSAMDQHGPQPVPALTEVDQLGDVRIPWRNPASSGCVDVVEPKAKRGNGPKVGPLQPVTVSEDRDGMTWNRYLDGLRQELVGGNND
jgi:hypothetical protein